MVRYETMFIVNPEIGEEAVAAVAEKFQGLIAENGEIESFAEWGGKRTLRYPINDVKEGCYYLCLFKAEPTFPAELERIYRINDAILRFLIINKDAE